MNVIPFKKLDKKTKDVLSTYEFPTKTKQCKKTDSKNELIKKISDAKGWDWILDTTVSKKCNIQLSNRQKNKLNKNYYIAITDNIDDKYNMYVSIFNDDFENPIKYCKIKSLTKKEIIWLTKIF